MLRNDTMWRLGSRRRGLRLQANGPGGGGLTYSEKVAAIAPGNMIGWWKMAEASGSVSIDSSPEANNGAYTAVTLGQTGIGDGLTAASFDGSTSFNNIYSAALASDFNGAEGTAAIWAKVSAAGVWTDGTVRRFYSLAVDNNNRIYIEKLAASNLFNCTYFAGGTPKGTNVACFLTVYFHIAITWSKAADEVKVYLNGVQSGATFTGLGTWAGSLGSTLCTIGSTNTTPASVFSGLLQHAMLWNTPLTAAQILQLATVP